LSSIKLRYNWKIEFSYLNSLGADTLAKSNLSFRLNYIDSGILIVIFLCILGYFTARSGHAGVNKVIEGSPRVAIEVYISGMKTKNLDIFKVGEKSAITIRNQPVDPPLVISAVKTNPKEISFLSPDAKKAIALPDPANAIAHDFYVTVAGEAEETKDGYVIRGNKIKIGNQVELEGRKYRIQGMVVDINSLGNP
jgi:hypothetical protein